MSSINLKNIERRNIMELSIGQKVKKAPIKTKEIGVDRVVRIGTIVDITKHCLTIEYENKTKESFTIADIISPQTFILKVRKGKEWERIVVPRGTTDFEGVRE
jgi:ribosome maturation factor RimP